MVRKVREWLENLMPNDITIVQCLDNSSFISSTEEGGDLPIRKFNNGDYHVDGDLSYVGKEKQHQLFKVIQPFLQLLEGQKVIFVIPQVRYDDPGLELNLRQQLADSKINYKDFLFCAGLGGFRVGDANPLVPNNKIDKEDDRCWRDDPVDLTTTGYERIVEALEREMEALKGGGKKRGADPQGGQAKRPRLTDTRAGWVTSTSGPARRVGDRV